MSFRDEDELDWGEEEYRNPALDEEDADAVDMVSLGDEEEIPQANLVIECEAEAPARSTTPQSTQELSSSPGKNRSGNGLSSQSSALGLSHLPPKPRTVIYGGRSRETIKAAAMSRPAPRSHSPPGTTPNDLPPNWEVRRSELTIYYYHTVLCASQLKKPTRDDARLDTKHSWQGESPPSPGLYRSLSARNAPSSRAAWPENSAPSRYQKSQRASSPPPRTNSPPMRSTPPEDQPRGRPESRKQVQQVQQAQQTPQLPRPRSISPASMLIPRQGQSPARGLAKNGNDSSNDTRNEPTSAARSDGPRNEFVQKSRREVWDRRTGRESSPPSQLLDHYSPEPESNERPSRNGRSARDTEALRAPRVTGSRRSRPYDESQDRGGMDHYSPPPEGDEAPTKPIIRRQSLSPPRPGGMRSDAMVLDQYANRRSGSPRPHGAGRNFDRPHAERANFEPRARPDLGRTRSDVSKGRDFARATRSERFNENVQRHDVGEFADPRGEEFRGRDIRPSPRGRYANLDLPSRHISGPVPHAREVEVFPRSDVEEAMFHDPPDIHPSRLERFREAPRPPRMGPGHPAQADLPVDAPHVSPHALRNDAPLPRHDPSFEPHSGYPRNQRAPNPHHRRERSPPAHERRLSPQEGDFIPANRGMAPPGPPRHELTRPRDPNPRGRQQDHQPQDRTSKPWERGVEVPTPPLEQGRYDGRRQDNNGRKNWRGEHSGRRHHSEEEPSFEPDRVGPPARYERPISPDSKRTYPAEDREWTPRQAPHAPLRMEMDVDSEPSPPVLTEPLPGWANFRQRDQDERPRERRSWGPKAWTGVPGEERGAPTIDSDEETRKRRRVDDGAEVVNTFSRTEHELRQYDLYNTFDCANIGPSHPARKVPHRSPVQRPKPQSPVNSFHALPNPVPSGPSAPGASVDFEAARARAKDVASQLARVNPSRPKSRFDVAAATVVVDTTAPAFTTIDADSSSKADVNCTSPTKVSELKDVKEIAPASAETHSDQKPKTTIGTGTNSPSQKSDDSSAPLVSRLVDASLVDPGRADAPQSFGGRPPFRENGRWKYNSTDRGYARPQTADRWRPENEEAPLDSPMRAWGKPNPSAHRGAQSNPDFIPNPERAFIPRHAVERNFVRNDQSIAHEGLPARPPAPTRRAPPSASRSQSDLRARTPPPRDRELEREPDSNNSNSDVRVLRALVIYNGG
ncbi:hypothetical protein FRC07_000751 [Ceratobasidium sp. 392]|nr:hypothetical protein FRC07_000751 [Ceratobasidium sp. 392]